MKLNLEKEGSKTTDFPQWNMSDAWRKWQCRVFAQMQSHTQKFYAGKGWKGAGADNKSRQGALQ